MNVSNISYCPVYLDSDLFVEESAVIELLANDVLFINSRNYICLDGTTKSETLVLFVACSDLFYWGTADAETLSYSELKEFYNAWKSQGNYGVMRWCCIKRNLQPQKPIKEEWIKSNKWDSILDSLPEPEPS